MSQLRAQRTTPKVRYNISLPTNQIKTLLAEAYRNEVQARRRVFVPDEKISSAMSLISDSLSGATLDSKFGIMLFGYMGNGKTTMLRAIAKVIRLCRYPLCSRDLGTMAIYDAGDIARIAANENSWREFRDTPLLAIDDFGKEATEVNTFGNISSPMIELLEYRYRRMLYTVISSNLQPGEVKDKYGQRVSDRLREMMDTVVFTNESFRL